MMPRILSFHSINEVKKPSDKRVHQTTAHVLQGAISSKMNAAQAMAVIDFATTATT
jgi:hypothetical protein